MMNQVDAIRTYLKRKDDLFIKERMHVNSIRGIENVAKIVQFFVAPKEAVYLTSWQLNFFLSRMTPPNMSAVYRGGQMSTFDWNDRNNVFSLWLPYDVYEEKVASKESIEDSLEGLVNTGDKSVLAEIHAVPSKLYLRAIISDFFPGVSQKHISLRSIVRNKLTGYFERHLKGHYL
jgi:hypothetical protein